MSDLLSAEEIAQLFADAEQGSLPEGPRRRAKRSHSIRKIDFSRPIKLSMAEQRRFERAHASYCRDASIRLSGELRTPVELEIINVSQLSWQGALEDVPQPSIRGVLACAPGKAAILVCIEEALMLRMIERLLGGSYTETLDPRRLTDVDTTLARHVIEELA